MLFKYKLAIEICKGQKTQTRRAVKPNEHYDAQTQSVYAGKKLKWQVGRTYGVQIRRGGHSLNQFVLKNIRCERAGDITEKDAIAEGFANRDEFFETWHAINGKGTLLNDVWVLEFEPVFKYGQQVMMTKCTYADMQHIPLPAIGRLSLNDSLDALFWFEIPFAGIGSRKFCVPINWLSPIAPEFAE